MLKSSVGLSVRQYKCNYDFEKYLCNQVCRLDIKHIIEASVCSLKHFIKGYIFTYLQKEECGALPWVDSSSSSFSLQAQDPPFWVRFHWVLL